MAAFHCPVCDEVIPTEDRNRHMMEHNDDTVPDDLDRGEFREAVRGILEARMRFAYDPCELWEGELWQRVHDLEVMVFGSSDFFDTQPSDYFVVEDE